MNDAELDAWLRLTHTPGLGPSRARELLKRYGLPEQVLAQSHSTLRTWLDDGVIEALHGDSSQRLERTRVWLQQPHCHVLTLADANYPQRLLATDDPPLLLYARGQVALLHQPRALALVGSRNASEQGLRDARRFAHELAARGVTVLSGLADGIDAQAHWGALEAAQAGAAMGASSTIAVLGTGCDRIYPAANEALAHRVAAEGLLLSEFALGTPPKAYHFPQRNRIISGLSDGVLVVEAALQSGSLITARLASEQGREVFAIPGSIHSPMSKGCHQLIKSGAKLVDDVRDIYVELGWEAVAPQARRGKRSALKPAALATSASVTNQAQPVHEPGHQPGHEPGHEPGQGAPVISTQAAPVETPLLRALGWSPCSAEDLAQRCGQSAASITTQLLELELSGEVARLPSGLYQRLASGR